MPRAHAELVRIPIDIFNPPNPDRDSLPQQVFFGHAKPKPRVASATRQREMRRQGPLILSGHDKVAGLVAYRLRVFIHSNRGTAEILVTPEPPFRFQQAVMINHISRLKQQLTPNKRIAGYDMHFISKPVGPANGLLFRKHIQASNVDRPYLERFLIRL